MSKVIMTCGKLSSGKSTYARKLAKDNNAVILSMDHLMLELFPEGAGEMHDLYALRTEHYLLSLSLEILNAGTDVILDWGLWTEEQRRRLRGFFTEHGVKNEIHYLRIRDEEWERRIRKRNSEKAGDPYVYYVDEGLLSKFRTIFQEPSGSEVDLVIDAG